MFSMPSLFLLPLIALLFILCVFLCAFFFRQHWLEKLQLVNAFGTVFVLLLAVYAFVMGRPDFIDLALIYAFINATGVYAFLKFAQKMSKLRDRGDV